MARAVTLALDRRAAALYFDHVRLTCPTCKRPLDTSGAAAAAPHRPFCSERCRAADLGSWLNAAYRFSAPISEEDMDQGLPTEGSSDDDTGERGGGDPPAN